MKGEKPRYPTEGWAFYEKCLSGTVDEELSHWRTVYQTSFLLFHHLKGESYPTLKYLQQKLNGVIDFYFHSLNKYYNNSYCRHEKGCIL